MIVISLRFKTICSGSWTGSQGARCKNYGDDGTCYSDGRHVDKLTRNRYPQLGGHANYSNFLFQDVFCNNYDRRRFKMCF